MTILLKDITLGRTVGCRSAGAARLHEIAYEPDIEFAPHAHARTSVSIILQGTGDDYVDGVRHDFGAFTVIVKPAGAVHRTRCGPVGMRSVTVELPSSIDRYLREHSRLLEECRWVHDASVTALMLQLFASVRRQALHGSAAISMWAHRFTNLASAAPPAITSNSSPHLQDALRIIRRDFRQPLRVSAIARELCVHPVYLARVFRTHGRRSIRVEIQRLRIGYAADRLVGMNGSIGRIAVQAGFADHGHLCREFRRYTGMTPSAYRELTMPVALG